MAMALLLTEVLSGIIALLFAAAAFVNMSWGEGASSQAMKRQSATKSRRLFVIAGVFAVICGICAYLSMR
jgi:uncharacterized membrane protein HdeD (DUF308 family)